MGVIHGLMSVEIKKDHVFIHLIENAPFNKGKNKLYSGVAGNLVAFTGKLPFKEDMMGTFHLFSRLNSLNIIIKLWALFILEEG